jgi:hypothetical protein
MPENGLQPEGKIDPSGCSISDRVPIASPVDHQTDLLGVQVRPAAAQPEQGEFYPDIDHSGELPPYQREAAHVPVLLETTGITSHARQLDLLSKRLVLKESIAAKLRSIGALDLAEPLDRCHTEQSWAQCNGCRKVRTFWNRCENFYCPNCQPTLAHERTESLEWWSSQLKQPKHVVVTTRNTATITWQRVKWFKQCLSKLRRRKFARNWLGGMWSIECTNEGKGWHIHAHILVDAKWIDPHELSRTWADIVGQDYAIVWVKDARKADYLREVTKYAVKGSMLSGWTALDIAHFINAFQGHRLFGVFGNLYGKRTEWRDFLNSLRAGKKVCECGCQTWRVYNEQEWLWKQTKEGSHVSARPNPPPKEQIDLLQPRAIPQFPRD